MTVNMIVIHLYLMISVIYYISRGALHFTVKVTLLPADDSSVPIFTSDR